MKKKTYIPALLFSVTTSVSALTFSACHTTESSNTAPADNVSAQPAGSTAPRGSGIDNGAPKDSTNFDGMKNRGGTLDKGDSTFK